jgi:hypothetical protein
MKAHVPETIDLISTSESWGFEVAPNLGPSPLLFLTRIKSQTEHKSLRPVLCL